MTVKVLTIASVPDELQQAWLQHLRDFDVAHPGCHFEIVIDGPPDASLAQMVKALQISPALTFMEVFERMKKPPNQGAT